MRMTKKNSGGLPAEKGAASAGLLPALAVTLAGVLFLPQMLLPEGRGLGFSNSFLSVTVFLLAFPRCAADCSGDGREREASRRCFFPSALCWPVRLEAGWRRRAICF